MSEEDAVQRLLNATTIAALLGNAPRSMIPHDFNTDRVRFLAESESKDLDRSLAAAFRLFDMLIYSTGIATRLSVALFVIRTGSTRGSTLAR
jgi:hypothetical protein